MKLSTPALHVRSIEVYRALFTAQIDDTCTAVRQNLKEWRAVHVVVLATGLKRGPSREDMTRMVLERLLPDGAVHDPEVPVDDPKVPEGTLVTMMPDAMKPKIAPEYSGWNYLAYLELRRRLKAFEERALGGVTTVPTVPTLFERKDLPVALDGGGTTSVAQLTKALEAVCAPDGKATFCDDAFGFEAPVTTVYEQAKNILSMPGRKRDALYFGDSWFMAFLPNGRVRVAMVETGE